MITPPLYSPAEVLRLDRRPVLVSVPRARTVLFALLGLASLARAVPTEMKSLPAGFGWADSSRTTVLESELEFTNTVGKTWQSSNFAPIYVMEESKPVFFKVAHVLWDSATQEFSFVPVDAVGEQAASNPCRAEVVEALGQVDVLDMLDTLQFDDDRACNQQVCNILSSDDPVVHHFHRVLLCNLESRLPKLVCKSILVDLLKGTCSQRVADLKSCPDNGFANGL